MCVKVFHLKSVCTEFYARGDAAEIKSQPVVAVKVSVGWIRTWSCDSPPPPCRCAVRSQACGDVVRELSNHNDDAVAEERERGPGVQRLRPLLQTAQCE